MSWRYHAPLRDMRFVIERVLNAPAHWAADPLHRELDLDTADAVLEQAARFASDVLLPANAPGDLQGCRLDADGVHTPAGYRAAYRAFVEGGWPALAGRPERGGQGLPLLVDAAVREMFDACNHAWTMYPDLLHGACETLEAHATDELKDRYLPKLVSGEWLAAMALTEPEAGSDLGQLRTRARPQPDGSLRVSGHKIFISGGDHDLTDNIVHLVLCRLPDAPAGTRGLSLVLVPKWLPDGRRNAMACDGLEKKMGIKGSATCAMRYDDATGWLIGEPNRGLAAMFVMMNSARLHVGIQGLGHQEMATQNALRHAAERVQMKQPIERHPAVRHILVRLQALTEAQRVIAYAAALALDRSAGGDEAQRPRALRRAALLTPIVKAFCTAQGFESATAAQQVYGGYGYVHDYGIEQTVRDVRIAMIYEGTNEIQAIDLVQRKLLADGGQAWAELREEILDEAGRCAADPALAVFGAAVRDQVEAASAGIASLAAGAADDPEYPLRAAGDCMAGLAHLLLAWAFAASARAARDEPDAAWAAAKTARMRYGCDWILPQAAVHWHRVGLRGAGLP